MKKKLVLLVVLWMASVACAADLQIDSFDDISSWSDYPVGVIVQGTAPGDPVYEGTGSLVADYTPGDGDAYYLNRSVSMDLSASVIGVSEAAISFWMYIGETSITGRLVNLLFETAYQSYYEYAPQPWNYTLPIGWHHIVVHQSDFTINGNPNWADINTIRITTTAYGNDGTPTDVVFDDLRLIEYEPPPITKTLRTYIVAGQSNADGFGVGVGNPPGVLPPQNLYDIGFDHMVPPNPNVKIFKGAYYNGAGQWNDMAPVFGFDDGSNNRFGPELAFGYEISDWLDEEIAIIKYVLSGTSLYSDWSPFFAGTNQYDYLLATIANAQVAANAGGFDLNIIGVAWMQGESDAGTSQNALAYEDNLEEFIAALRADLNAPDLQFYVATIKDVGVWIYRSLIWQAQSTVAANDPDVYLVTGSDMTAYEHDGVCCGGYHYDALGQVTLGQRFAVEAINNTCIVKWEDLMNFASYWLGTNPQKNIDGTGKVYMMK